jgi:hypothetical protein
MDNVKPFRHFSIPQNVQFDADEAITSISRKFMMKRVKQIDQTIIHMCLEIAKESGVTDLYLIDEGFVLNAMKKQIPMEPRSDPSAWDIHHYCPVRHNGLDAPTVQMFKDGSYCDRCGQKIKWGDCSD